MTDQKRVFSIDMPSRSLLPEERMGSGAWLAGIQKAEAGVLQPSQQGQETGRVEHPFDMERARVLRDFNVHHATCLETKTAAAIGLGWLAPEISETLDPLCESTFDDLCEQVVADIDELGNGAIEVVRDASGAIAGLYYADAASIYVYLDNEEDPNSYHFEMDAESTGTNQPGVVKFARWGKLAEVEEAKSELIWFRDPARGLKYYGKMSWAAGVPKMELEQAITQHNFDFFLNRCVPELLFLVTGTQVAQPDWDAIEARFKEHVGLRRQRKTMALNIPGEGVEATVHPLGAEVGGETEGFGALSEALSLQIVSAHRVPPLLAGIQIPGKLGAANEMTNSMLAFQTLVIAPRQKSICKTFARTLGDPETNGGLALTADQFFGKGLAEDEPDPLEAEMGVPPQKPKDRKGNGLRTIVDEMDLGQMETASKMRMSMVEAKARGRDMSAGPAERGSDVQAGRGTGTVA